MRHWHCKWNESGFRPPLCTYRLNWARRTSWERWDDWDDTVLQTQDSKFEPWRSEAEHATSRSRRLPTILTFIRGWGRNIFVSFKPPRPETEPRTLAWKAAVLTTTLGPLPHWHCNKRPFSVWLFFLLTIAGRNEAIIEKLKALCFVCQPTKVQSCITVFLISTEITLNVQNNHSFIFKGFINAQDRCKCSWIRSQRNTPLSYMVHGKSVRLCTMCT